MTWSELPKSIQHFCSDTLDWLWPRCCGLCDNIIQTGPGRSICSPCREKLLADPWPTCPRCSSTVGPHTDNQNGCPRCRDESFRFVSVQRLGPYDGIWRDAVLALKKSSGLLLAEELGELYGERLKSRNDPAPDWVVPIPLHWRRRWVRGHNQSLGLSRGICRVTGWHLGASWLEKKKNTPSQTSFTAQARRENLQGAFAARRGSGLQKMRILLVDDVLTTGSTANAATEALMGAGAAQVAVAVLAHR